MRGTSLYIYLYKIYKSILIVFMSYNIPTYIKLNDSGEKIKIT